MFWNMLRIICKRLKFTILSKESHCVNAREIAERLICNIYGLFCEMWNLICSVTWYGWETWRRRSEKNMKLNDVKLIVHYNLIIIQTMHKNFNYGSYGCVFQWMQTWFIILQFNQIQIFVGVCGIHKRSHISSWRCCGFLMGRISVLLLKNRDAYTVKQCDFWEKFRTAVSTFNLMTKKGPQLQIITA